MDSACITKDVKFRQKMTKSTISRSESLRKIIRNEPFSPIFVETKKQFQVSESLPLCTDQIS